MLKIGLTFSLFFLSFFLSPDMFAQFYTVRKTAPPEYILLSEKGDVANTSINQEITDTIPTSRQDSVIDKDLITRDIFSRKRGQVRKKQLSDLPALTILNLMEEIKRNGIQHPKIVLAQAILETGWFQSNVCRTKNNLFGLTNPRTGQYYEFNHWTESVKAYYTKVQYRYKGGNYLLWLKKIGYAEAPDYIQSLASILTQYMID